MAVQISVQGVQGVTASLGGEVTGVVRIENATGDAVGVSGINLVAEALTAGFDKTQIVLGTIDPSGYGNANTSSALSSIAAGETGSYPFACLAKTTQLLVAPTAQFNLYAAAIYNGTPASSSLSSPATFEVSAQPLDAVVIDSPYIVWSLSQNARPVQNSNFDFQLNTYTKSGTQLLAVPPEYNNDYQSSDTGVLTVNASGKQGYADVNGMAKIVGGAGAVTVVGIGTATITNAIASGATGSITIKVVA